MTTFAERMAELRQEAGLSQRVLAGLVGYLSVYLLRALGHKNLAGMMKVISVVLVVAGLVNATAQAIVSLKESALGQGVTWIFERVK